MAHISTVLRITFLFGRLFIVSFGLFRFFSGLQKANSTIVLDTLLGCPAEVWHIDLTRFKNCCSIQLFYFIVSFDFARFSQACGKLIQPFCLLEAWRGFNLHYSWVVQRKCGTHILPDLRTTTLFGSILLFLLSAHLDLCMTCAKTVKSLCLLEA